MSQSQSFGWNMPASLNLGFWALWALCYVCTCTKQRRGTGCLEETTHSNARLEVWTGEQMGDRE